MRSYLVTYFYIGGQGRTFIDTSAEPPVTRRQIEEWERIIRTQNNMTGVGVTGFFEIAYPALTENPSTAHQQQEAAGHEQ